MDDQSAIVPKANNREALLLTTSATTGWLDWLHGEPWLFPTGLLRIPLGLTATLLHGMRSQELPTWHNFDEKTFEAFLALKRSFWIPQEQIQEAYLHRGITTDRLRLKQVDQRTIKFLWLPWDGAWKPLQEALQEWLGDRLIID